MCINGIDLISACSLGVMLVHCGCILAVRLGFRYAWFAYKQPEPSYCCAWWRTITIATAMQAKLDEALEERREAKGDAEALKSQSRVSTQ